MTIIICYHFGLFANPKSYNLLYIKKHPTNYFLGATSYNHFIELIPHAFFLLMLFMKLQAFGNATASVL